MHRGSSVRVYIQDAYETCLEQYIQNDMYNNSSSSITVCSLTMRPLPIGSTLPRAGRSSPVASRPNRSCDAYKHIQIYTHSHHNRTSYILVRTLITVSIVVVVVNTNTHTHIIYLLHTLALVLICNSKVGSSGQHTLKTAAPQPDPRGNRTAEGLSLIT